VWYARQIALERPWTTRGEIDSIDHDSDAAVREVQGDACAMPRQHRSRHLVGIYGGGLQAFTMPEG
jgi:hypothetical protein